MSDIEQCMKEFEAWHAEKYPEPALYHRKVSWRADKQSRGRVWLEAWNRRTAPVVTEEMARNLIYALSGAGLLNNGYRYYDADIAAATQALTAALEPDNAN